MQVYQGCPMLSVAKHSFTRCEVVDHPVEAKGNQKSQEYTHCICMDDMSIYTESV